MSDLPTCLCGAPLVLPDRAGYCCSDQACGMFDPDGDLTIGDWRHINAIVARKVTEATNRLAAENARLRAECARQANVLEGGDWSDDLAEPPHATGGHDDR